MLVKPASSNKDDGGDQTKPPLDASPPIVIAGGEQQQRRHKFVLIPEMNWKNMTMMNTLAMHRRLGFIMLGFATTLIIITIWLLFTIQLGGNDDVTLGKRRLIQPMAVHLSLGNASYSMVATWLTAAPSDSIVMYGEATSCPNLDKIVSGTQTELVAHDDHGNPSSSSIFVHRATLGGLKPNTTYGKFPFL